MPQMNKGGKFFRRIGRPLGRAYMLFEASRRRVSNRIGRKNLLIHGKQKHGRLLRDAARSASTVKARTPSFRNARAFPLRSARGRISSLQGTRLLLSIRVRDGRDPFDGRNNVVFEF